MRLHILHWTGHDTVDHLETHQEIYTVKDAIGKLKAWANSYDLFSKSESKEIEPGKFITLIHIVDRYDGEQMDVFGQLITDKAP